MKEGAKFAQAAKTFKHSEVKSINFRILCILRDLRGEKVFHRMAHP